jgi:hypothetical protein
VAALAALYDPLVRPSISTRFSGLTAEQSAVELAVFAGAALGRVWAPKLFGALRSATLSPATAERQAAELDASSKAAVIAFSAQFRSAAQRGALPVSSSKGAFDIWADVAELAVRVEGGRWQPTNSRRASQLRLVGIRIVDFLRRDAGGRQLADVRRKDANGVLGVGEGRAVLRNVLFAPLVDAALAASAIAAATRDVQLDLLAFECVAVLVERRQTGGGSSSSSSM